MFDCPPDHPIQPWEIQGENPCTRVRVLVNGTQELCPASKAYWLRSYARTATDDYQPENGQECL